MRSPTEMFRNRERPKNKYFTVLYIGAALLPPNVAVANDQISSTFVDLGSLSAEFIYVEKTAAGNSDNGVVGRFKGAWEDSIGPLIDDLKRQFGMRTIQAPPVNTTSNRLIEVMEVELPEVDVWTPIFYPVDLGDQKIIIASNETEAFELDTDDLIRNRGAGYNVAGGKLRIVLTPSGNQEEMLRLEDITRGFDVHKENRLVSRQHGPKEIPEQQEDMNEEAACGVDDRRPQNEPRVGRIYPRLCTAFLLEGGILATAGHCFRNDQRDKQFVHFNTERSDENGTPVVARPADQYKVDADTIICEDCTPPGLLEHGNDWAVFFVIPNTITGLSPLDAQRGFYSLHDDVAITNTARRRVRVDGFGANLFRLNESYTNQTADGDYAGLVRPSVDGDAEVGHWVDTEGGNSGSPIIALDDSTGPTDFVFGIHTGGRCDPPQDSPNRGTGFSHKRLQAAIKKLRELQLTGSP
ncbi:trypsin-like serine peptidase [Marinivivus vitaminiproducens]|uniref:trypsin-like serine peptidase n=1 Tax=Marinivivus vitaminiproducens TaxID=3035935 RepID=UPI0027A51D11|nr:trypsin-like serine protease [Geminicoccaceae bacterium SCSIO 64248]